MSKFKLNDIVVIPQKEYVVIRENFFNEAGQELIEVYLIDGKKENSFFLYPEDVIKNGRLPCVCYSNDSDTLAWYGDQCPQHGKRVRTI